MAANDILVRLLMDANGYNRDLSRSENKTKEFERNVRSKINSAAATFTKLAGAVGLGVSAFEIFNKTIKASQATSDAYDKVMRAATGSVNNFFTAISTGDFSAFSAGMDAMITKAMAAQSALDQLGNTTMSYGYFSSKNQADFADALAVLRNKNSSEEEKAAAKATVDRVMGNQKEITAEFQKRTNEAIGALVVEGNQLDASMITRDVVDNVIALDIKSIGDQEKKRLQARYDEYVKKLNQTRSKYSTTTYSSSNWGTTSQTTTNEAAVKSEMASVNAEYLDAIAYNEILNKHNDEWLSNLIGIAKAADDAARSYAGMVDQQREVMTGLNTPTPTGGGGSAPVVYGAGSLGAINQQLTALQQQFTEATDEGTRVGIQQAIDQLNAQKKTITFYAEVKARGGEPGAMSNELPGLAGTSLSLPDFSKMEIKNPFKAEDIDTNNKYADSLAAIGGIMGNLSSVTGEGAAAWLTWGANLMSAVAQALPAISTLIAAKTAEGAVAAGASAAETPIIGWLLAAGAIASFLAAAAAVPKFAEGGVVGGSSFIGDKQLAYLNSGEMVLSGSQQAKLFDMINNGGSAYGGGQVEFKIKGQELYGVLQNYGNKRSKVR